MINIVRDGHTGPRKVSSDHAQVQMLSTRVEHVGQMSETWNKKAEELTYLSAEISQLSEETEERIG